MKIFYRSNCFRGMLKPLATLLLFFVLIVSANAQLISINRITPPAVVTAVGSLDPAVLVGTTVTVTDALGSTCPNVTYEWQSATDEYFTQNLTRNLANTKDYDPGMITTTTYIRRVASVECTSPQRYSMTECGAIKITIN